jgi:hypothetical protein
MASGEKKKQAAAQTSSKRVLAWPARSRAPQRVLEKLPLKDRVQFRSLGRLGSLRQNFTFRGHQAAGLVVDFIEISQISSFCQNGGGALFIHSGRRYCPSALRSYYRTIDGALNIRPVEAPRSTRAQRVVRRNHHSARTLDVDLLGRQAAHDRHRWAIGRKPKLTSKAPTFWRFAIVPVRRRLAALRRSQRRARSDRLAIKFPRIQECDRKMPVLHRQSVGAAQGATLIAPFSGLKPRCPRADRNPGKPETSP